MAISVNAVNLIFPLVCFRSMLSKGSSRPWPDVLEELTGFRRMDAGALLDYFKPLQLWLERQNARERLGWTRQCPDDDQLRRTRVDPSQMNGSQPTPAFSAQSSLNGKSTSAVYTQSWDNGKSTSAVYTQSWGNGEATSAAGMQSSGRFTPAAGHQKSGCYLVGGQFTIVLTAFCISFIFNRDWYI